MRRTLLALAAGFMVFTPDIVAAQDATLPRLPPQILDVVSPSTWVQGGPGQMVVQRGQCREFPTDQLRRRIVDIAVQEWAFFGFPALDLRNGARLTPPGAFSGSEGGPPQWSVGQGRTPPLGPQESARVASTIAGYWAATPQGPGIVREQNGNWNGPSGVAARWRAPWSAAFISWCMSSAGAGKRFLYSASHAAYINQAIANAENGAFTSSTLGHPVTGYKLKAGDLIGHWRGDKKITFANAVRRGWYESHVDIVVEVHKGFALSIGGNVMHSVTKRAVKLGPNGELKDNRENWFVVIENKM